MRMISYQLLIESFNDRYSYTKDRDDSANFELSDLSLFGSVDEEVCSGLFYFEGMPGRIDVKIVEGSDRTGKGELSNYGISCQLLVTQRQATELRAILAKLTEGNISLSFFVIGDLSNPERLSIPTLVKDGEDFSFDFDIKDISHTASYHTPEHNGLLSDPTAE